MRFRQIFVVGPFALHQIRHRVQPQSVDTQIQPESHDGEHFLQHPRIVEIEVRLVGIKPVPIILPRHRIQRPVGPLRIDENDPRAGVFLVVVGPHIKIAINRTALRSPGPLKPGMLVGCVVDHQFGNDADAVGMCGGDEPLHIGQCAIVGMDAPVIADVVPVVQSRRRVKRQQPDGVDPEAGDIVELARSGRENRRPRRCWNRRMT